MSKLNEVTAEQLAEQIHMCGLMLAPGYGYELSPDTNVDWCDMAPARKRFMVDTADHVLDWLKELANE